MILLIVSFAAGVLTVAAPCILPLLPVIIGGSLIEAGQDKQEKQLFRPLIIAGSLAASVITFTLLIKATTALLGVPVYVWQILSGLVVTLLGIYFLWPHGWEKISVKSGLFVKSNQALGKVSQKKGIFGAALIGAALGPVFSSCSPTYALIVATVIPASFLQGLIYLTAYAFGMSLTLLLIAILGQTAVSKLQLLSNPRSWLKTVIGVLFIVVGVSVMFGLDKKLQALILENGWYSQIDKFERRLTN